MHQHALAFTNGFNKLFNISFFDTFDTLEVFQQLGLGLFTYAWYIIKF